MKRLSTLWIATLATLLMVPALARAEIQPGKQVSESFDLAGGGKLGYLLYVPADYGKEKDKSFPVILFLHGSGEAGNGTTDLDRVKLHGPPRIVEQKKGFPFIVISPQNPPKQFWKPAEVKALLDSVMGKLKQADPDRVYLTGLSLGGFGTWATAAAYPDVFAAIAPICGGGNVTWAARLKDIPTWAVHGDKDTSVKVERSIEMVDAMKAAGAKEVHLTRHPEGHHDVWTVTYDDPAFYDWLLKHKRGSAEK